MKWSDLDDTCDWHWVDYAEGVLDEKDRQSLELVLSHSEIDREIVQGYVNIKNAIKAVDDTDCEFSDRYYQDLTSRIMCTILKDGDTAKPSVAKVIGDNKETEDVTKRIRDQ